jgi:hypothetical protein
MYEERLGWPTVAWWGLGILIAFFIIGSAAGLAATPRVGLLTIVLLLVVVALMVTTVVIFRELRIAIDETTLTVGFGPLVDRVPLTRIAACGPTTYRWVEYGGWGIRYNLRHPSRRAKLYNVMGDGGQAVELLLDGGRRRLLFSSRDPNTICQELRSRHRAIQPLPDGGT